MISVKRVVFASIICKLLPKLYELVLTELHDE